MVTTSTPLPPPLVRDDPVALAHWRELAGELEKAGHLPPSARPVFAAMCLHWAMAVKAILELRQHGEVSVGSKGVPVISPWIRVRNSALDMYRREAVHLGLSASLLMQRAGAADPDAAVLVPANTVWDTLVGKADAQ